MTGPVWKDAAQAELDALHAVHEQLGMVRWQIKQGFEFSHVAVDLAPKEDQAHIADLAAVEAHWLSALRLIDHLADKLAMAEGTVERALQSSTYDPELAKLQQLMDSFEPVLELLDGHLQMVPAKHRAAVVEALTKMDAQALPVHRAARDLAGFAPLAALAPIEQPTVSETAAPTPIAIERLS